MVQRAVARLETSHLLPPKCSLTSSSLMLSTSVSTSSDFLPRQFANVRFHTLSAVDCLRLHMEQYWSSEVAHPL